MANYAGIKIEFTGFSALGSGFDLTLDSVLYQWYCRPERDEPFEYTQGTDDSTQAAFAYQGMSQDIDASPDLNVSIISPTEIIIIATDFGVNISAVTRGTVRATVTNIAEVAPVTGTRHFFNVKDKRTGLYYQGEIVDKNYSGSVNQITCFETSPFSIKQRYFDNDGIVWAKAKKCTLNFPVVDDSNEAEYDYLFESYWKDVSVNIYYDGNIHFKGWMKPQESVKDYIEFPKMINITASDGIEELKEIPVVEDDGNDISEFLDVSPKDVISMILRDNELLLELWILNGTIENTYMLSTEQLLEVTDVLNVRYQRQVDGEVGWVNSHEAISTTLSPFNCFLTQAEGKWWIINNSQYEGDVFKYSSDGTYLSKEFISLTKTVTGLCSSDNGNVRYDPPLARVRLVTRNSSFLGPANPNSNFSNGSNSWAASSDWFLTSFTGNIVQLTDINGYVAANNYDLTSDQFLVNANGDFTVTFYIRHRVTAVTGHNNMDPRLEIEWNINGGTFVRAGNPIELNNLAIDSWVETSINVATTQAANFQMQIRANYFDNSSQNWDTLEVEISEFWVVPTYSDNLAYDQLRVSKRLDIQATKVLEYEQFFSGDVPLSTIAGLLVNGNDGPFTFHRYGKTEAFDLGYILSVSVLNYFNKFVPLLTVNYFYDQLIDTNHLISHDSKLWNILAYSIDPFNGVMNLTLREFHEGSDVAYDSYELQLESIDGYNYTFG